MQLKGEHKETLYAWFESIVFVSCSEFQSQLPASGAPALPPQSDQTSQLYEEYVRQRTLQNWRFWLVSSHN